MANRKRVIAAQDDSGRRVDVWEITPQIPAGTFDDPAATVDGLARLQLTDGLPVNAVGEDFVVVRTGERFRRT